MKLIMFAGAGSVGKTKLLEACIALAETRRLRVGEHKSTTRKTYERHGYTQENDALKDPVTNCNFQHEVMKDNIDALEVAVEQGKLLDVIFADRTPHDYAAYYFTVFPDFLNLQTIEMKRHLADTTLARMYDQVEQVVIYVLPFPCYWSVDTESSDGWRRDTTGKNLTWSNNVEAEVMNIKRRLEMEGFSHDHIVVKRLSPFLENGTPEERAIGILAEEFPFKGRFHFDDHPPSRHCGCKRCVADFEEKDKSPADGLIFENGRVPDWNETNAQTALIMGLNGTPAQKEEARKFFSFHTLVGFGN